MHRLAAQYGDFEGLADWSKIPDIKLCVPALLAHCQAHYADREMSVVDDTRLTYGEAVARSAALARQLLAAGIGKASRVGMLFPNGPEFIVTWLAITRIGAVAVPISTLSSGPELKRIVRHADLHLLITVNRYRNHDYVERLAGELPELATARAPYLLNEAPYLRAIWVWGPCDAPWAQAVDLSRPSIFGEAMLAQIEAEVFPADIVSIIYTSGSTAEPKGVMHSHGAFLRQAIKCAVTYPYRGDDRIFTQMPFFWVGGLTLTLLNAMITGSTLLSSSATGSGLLDFLERERVTYISGWLHMMIAMGADPSLPHRDFSHIRGGGLIEILPAEKRPKNQRFGNALGMTETCGPHTIAMIDFPDHLKGSFGPPMPGMEHKIVDVETGEELGEDEPGELLVRGDALTQGFVKMEREQVFERDGWYRTRDYCSFRERNLIFHGRTDDMIKSSGANVSPREVEAAIAALPGVTQAVVLGVPDVRRSSVVGAVIVLAPDVPREGRDFRTELTKSLSSYKVPRVLITMETGELPMMSSGKVDRLALIRLLTEAGARTE